MRIRKKPSSIKISQTFHNSPAPPLVKEDNIDNTLVCAKMGASTSIDSNKSISIKALHRNQISPITSDLQPYKNKGSFSYLDRNPLDVLKPNDELFISPL